jgi:L-2,4-diaminobutyrate decarboxylase
VTTADRRLFGGGAADALRAAGDCLEAAARERTGPYSGASPQELAAVAAAVEPFPEEGVGLAAALDQLGRLAVRHGVDPGHPACAAHLHCQPLAAAVAADALVAATNPSLDSWDQAPVATHLEQRLVAALAARVGYPPAADGVVTSGSTQSNLMGLLLARDRAAAWAGRDVAADGFGPDAGRLAIVCSELAHFSVARAASVLGLGSRAVQRLPVDADRRLALDELDRALDRTDADGRRPIALVATAGTTDFGSIDRCRHWPDGPASGDCGCTSTPPTAAACCSATATAASWTTSSWPTRSRSTSISCCGSRPAAAHS